MSVLLETKGLGKTFGGLKAVQSVDLVVSSNTVFSIIGPNGAGKTTLFNCLTGIYRPEYGSIHFEGKSIAGLKPHKICRRGVARTFQNIRLFGEMTVLENVLVGGTLHRRFDPLGILLHTPGYRAAEKADRDFAVELLSFVGLETLSAEWARNLPYGLQRRLEIVRALATKPKLLLLDEPAAGMNPRETDEMIALIDRLRARGLAVILIEHHMKLVMQISDEVMVLDHGERIATGTPAQVRRDPKVIAAYLGKEA